MEGGYFSKFVWHREDSLTNMKLLVRVPLRLTGGMLGGPMTRGVFLLVFVCRWCHVAVLKCGGTSLCISQSSTIFLIYLFDLCDIFQLEVGNSYKIIKIKG